MDAQNLVHLGALLRIFEPIKAAKCCPFAKSPQLEVIEEWAESAANIAVS